MTEKNIRNVGRSLVYPTPAKNKSTKYKSTKWMEIKICKGQDQAYPSYQIKMFSGNLRFMDILEH